MEIDDIQAINAIHSQIKRNVPRKSRREDALIMIELNDPVMDAIIEDLNYKYWMCPYRSEHST